MSDPYKDLPGVLDVPQAATFLGCSERHLRNLIVSGELEIFRLGHLVRIARHQILELLGANGSADPKAGATTNATTTTARKRGRRGG